MIRSSSGSTTHTWRHISPRCRQCDCFPISPACPWFTRRCMALAAPPCWRHSNAPGFRRRSSFPSNSSRIPRFRQSRFRIPRNLGRWTCCLLLRRRAKQLSRCATTLTPIAWAPRSRRRMVGGGGCWAMRSAGYWPITSCDKRQATIGSSSPRWCRRRCCRRWPLHTASSLRRRTRGSSGSATPC